MREFFVQYCHDCHSGASAEAGFRLDSIGADLSKESIEFQWQRVFDKLDSRRMPPADAKQPSKQLRQEMIAVIGERLRDANFQRRGSQGRAALRRLTRFEYENTLHDLLAIDAPLVEFLPEDATSHGFDKVGSALRLSPVHLEQYIAAAAAAIDAAIVHEPAFAPIQEKIVIASNRGDVYLRRKVRLVIDDGVVLFGGTPDPATPWKSPARGTYRFRLLLETYQSETPLTCAIRAGDFTRRTGRNHLVGYFDIEPGAKREIEFNASINAGESVRFLTFGIDGKPKFNEDGVTEFAGPGIWLGPLEIEGPVGEKFPPESHRRLFGDLPLEQVAGKYNPTRTKRRTQRTAYHEVATNDPKVDAAGRLRQFAQRAFRRPIDESSLKPMAALVNERLDRGDSFEQAMRTGYIAVLCSADFLFVTRPRASGNSRSTAGPSLDEFELASRLSYLLWSSMPDDELMRLARAETLSQEAVLREQVERMLSDTRSERFVRDFVGQWLDLKLIDFTTPDRRLYPDFDELLKVSMVEESRRFFRELLDQDLSVTNFIDSDFAIVNERLAAHYGIEGVEGQEFRRIALPPGSHRGGVLTQAAVLKVTADGTRTSPVLRGVWALERIIGRPVPPPPPGVPGLEPDIRGATTVREQLDLHRSTQSCAVCHRHIDPLGFAMESYDVIGGWRQQYRISPAQRTARGRVVNVAGYRRPISYRLGPDVDAAGKLHDGRQFADMDELKALLSAESAPIARCLIEKLVTYATGCPVEFVDRAEVEGILSRTESSGHGLKSIIHEIVQSSLFTNK